MDIRATAKLIDGSTVKGRLTTDHAASSYGQPVFVGEDGQAIDWISIVSVDVDAAAQLGASKSERKAAASRRNGRSGGRPPKQ